MKSGNPQEAPAEEPRHCPAVIVGAGFAGLYALFKLRQMGIGAQVFEAASDVGGVWFWNRYPGARCDVESMQYSYSVSEELQQEWHWSERFAPQSEILEYLQHVADRFDLRRDISFETSVQSAVFDEDTGLWEVRTDKGDHIVTPFCIMASGSLSVTKLPDLKGIDAFQGRIVHTGDWPPQEVDFTGLRVGVIGTGSSGVQAIPIIAGSAKQLVVFQRTPNFVIPARNEPLAAETERYWKDNYPEFRERARQIGTFFEFSDKAAHQVSAEEREKEYRRRWEGGGINFVYAFKDIYLDQAANDTAADFVHARIRDAVEDPVVAARLSPKGYPLGAKRICIGTDYYETFNRENVTLVDLRETPITEVTTDSVATADATYPIDLLICATGYDALTGALLRIDIRGRNGMSLQDKWSAGPRNYLGLMTAGFPNMFVVTGPGSPSVLINMVVGIEQHVDWITGCIAYLRKRGATTIEPAPSAEDAWVQHVNDEADRTLFPKADSWYVGANIPGKPRVFLPYVGSIGRYRKKCDEVAADGYKGFMIE